MEIAAWNCPAKVHTCKQTYWYIWGCPICNQAAEDVKHLMFQCQPAVELWTRLGILDRISDKIQSERSGSVILEELFIDDSNSVSVMSSVGFKEILLTGGWYLWWIRRQVTHNEQIPPVWRWPMSVLAITNNYKKSLNRNAGSNEERWVKPDPNFVKLNVDASFHVDVGAGATAAVLRDDHGNFIAAQGIYVDRGADVITMEAMAMRDGLMMANSLGFHNVEAESDSLDVINFCTGRLQWWDAVAAIFAECLDTATSIGRVRFKHCLRATNSVAHMIARHSFCNRNSLSWINEPPGWLMSTLVDDVSVNV